MTLSVFTSNRLEILAETLADVLRTPLGSPLDQEVIVVQSLGMERWLCMELAHYHGICANYRFPFPNTFVQQLIYEFLPELTEVSPFDPGIMTWRIMEHLPSCLPQPAFKPLRVYLSEDRVDLKRFQLSERIADLFDQYLLFRPDMIFRWESGAESHWQALLWRELVKGQEGMHRAALGRAFLQALSSSRDVSALPDRVTVFGISTLPRFYMQVLEALSHFLQVNIFLMNPCGEFWGDILSEWEMKRIAGRETERVSSYEELHLEKGNSLLASMGALGREFFDMVNEFDKEDFTSFQDPGEGTLLHCVQSDILHLRDRAKTGFKRPPILGDDKSIQVHSCHGPKREMEVLQDYLLDRFDKDPMLQPKDILVMTPDIEAYAPYIQAVFDVPPDDPKRIPFSIADQSIRKESEIIDSFFTILDLWESRFGAQQVMALLESRTIGCRFGLSEMDVGLIREWVRKTHIRWGIDHESRNQAGLPAFEENTWKAGIDRLLLGYAMPGHNETLFEGILPYDHIEGSETQVLGTLAEFLDLLDSKVNLLGQIRTLGEWSPVLMGLLDDFFLHHEEGEREMQVLRRSVLELEEIEKLSGYTEKVDIHVIKSHLVSCFEREGFGFGFITGGITFCAMLPMRSIPFRVICLVGMNGDAYPRESRPLGFDLMAKKPRPGDRSRRNDDRYLFLEAILSARDTLYLSYVGQSIQDNSPISPSVLVSELMDYMEQGFANKGKRNILEQILIKHRLQAFSPEYFKSDGNLFSYSKENFETAKRLIKGPKDPAPFFSIGLKAPDQEWRNVDVEGLCRFFGNPTRFLLNNRLGIFPEDEVPILEDKEAFSLKGLEKYLLEARLLIKRLGGQDLKKAFGVTRASGQLPHGTVGRCIYEHLIQGIDHFAEKTGSLMEGETLDPLEIDLQLGGMHLTGQVGPIYPHGLIHFRYAKTTARDLLRLWITHLLLNQCRSDLYPRKSIYAGLESNQWQERGWASFSYSPVKDPEIHLAGLLDRYWSGLRAPLQFYPESSYIYAREILSKRSSDEQAMLKAKTSWLGSDYVRGECKDPSYHLCFKESVSLGQEFREISLEIFEPLIAHKQEPISHQDTKAQSPPWRNSVE